MKALTNSSALFITTGGGQVSRFNKDEGGTADDEEEKERGVSIHPCAWYGFNFPELTNRIVWLPPPKDDDGRE